jgi:hypothetical protein
MSTNVTDLQQMTQQEILLLKPDGSVNLSDKRRKGKYVHLLRLDRQMVKDYARRHAVANVDTASYEDIIEGLLDEGTTRFMIGKWLNKTFERQARDANSRFQVLQESETLEDLFMRLKGHCATHQANND